jgi:succinate-semialdehyde dehydrogenase/glutarate-semialdehyde dehydrogenase
MKRTTMELGGHAPVVVFQDADVEEAVTMVAAAKFRNAGQVCIAPSRFYVHELVYESFARRFAEIAASLVVGAGMEPKSQMGPLANVRRLDAMEKLTEDARKSGEVVTGGERVEGNGGYFFRPTVVTGLPDHAKLMTSEPFGPIAPIVSFRTFDEVVQRVNALPYALASYAFTQSTKTALAISNEIEAGMVGINTMAISTPETPFGGVKESGHGQEGGIEGLDAYTNCKFIAAA